jgi:CheY-like chemotaxis protein/HPt (histidine-containing phosphotransfer) domain-containing protein
VNQRLIVGLLELHGHELTVVSTGLAAVEHALKNNYDVVLMDVQMPELDGLQATQRIRDYELKHGGHLPIVAMTAHALPEDRERCLAAGMDDYVAKPLREARLLEAITRATGKAAHGIPAGTVPAVRISSETATMDSDISTNGSPNGQLVNWRKALEFCQEDESLLRVVVEAFLEESPLHMQSIREGIEQRQAEKLHRAAHTIKGSMRYLGADSLFQTAYTLEQLGSAGEFAGAEEVAAKLEEGLGQLTPLLQKFLAEGLEATVQST